MKLLFLIVGSIFISGCATVTYRAHKGFETYFDDQKSIAIMPPDIKINQLTAGGISELMDEWTEDAKAKVLNAIKSELDSFSHIKTSVIDEKNIDAKYKDFLKEENGLYKAVASSIIFHTYDPIGTFPHKIKNFDYTLGPDISKLKDITGADTLLFCSGSNYIWTAGRVYLATFSVLLGASVIPAAGPEWLSLSLVDIRSGNVIWFDYIPMQGDLRDEEVDKRLIKKLFSSFPDKWK